MKEIEKVKPKVGIMEKKKIRAIQGWRTTGYWWPGRRGDDP